MFLVLMYLPACDGCRPTIPDPVDPNGGDTSADSAVDSSPETAGPVLPPRCDLVETEPNDVSTATQTIPTEQWVCGVLLPADVNAAPYGDVDYLGFTAPEAGWVEVNVEAARRGSAADVQFILYDDHDSITATDSYLSTDPIVRFPADEPTSYTVVLGETSLLFGEDYTWYLLASVVKPPVRWDFTETEPNNNVASATSFTPGQTVFGTIGSPGDFDWYHLVTSPKATTIRFTMNAFVYGSVIDGQLTLYASDGTTMLRDDTRGEIDYDLDPFFEYKQTEASDWYLLVRNELTRGNHFHWYTVSIEEIVE